jgi:hypothetical protein
MTLLISSKSLANAAYVSFYKAQRRLILGGSFTVFGLLNTHLNRVAVQ